MRSHPTGRSIGTMMTRAMLGAMLLAISGTGAILAVEPGEDPGAEPPPLPIGVTADATVTVTFLEPAEAGGDPIVGADVTLLVSRSGEGIQWFFGQTDESGVATFDGVARASDGGDATTAVAYGSLFPTMPEPPDGECVAIDGWSGTSTDTEVTAVTTITMEAVAEKIESCSGGGGTVELPEGVIADATLTVTVVDDHGSPLPGASVSLLATSDAGVTFYFEGWTETDALGVATFTDLPRPDTDGPPVAWYVQVSAAIATDADGCTLWTSFEGTAWLEATAGVTETEVTALPAGEKAGECADPGEGAPVLHGVVLDPEGDPMAGAHGSLWMTRADGATWYLYEFVTGEDGTFDLAIHAWGTDEAPAQLQLVIRGETTRTEPGEPCDTAFGLMATFEGSVALAAGGEPDPIELTAAEAELGVICPETPGSEAGAGDGDDRSDPPTDTEEFGAVASIEFWRALIILTAAVIATLAVALAPRRSTPIKVRRDDRTD